MIFVHEQPDFGDFLSELARERRLPRSQVEKDYWITHTLWALQAAGLEVWFKGGTCLSKGYGIIERFSEDLDLKLESGTMAGAPPTPNWKGEKASHIRAREDWFRTIAARLYIPGCEIRVNADLEDERWRSVVYEVIYPGSFLRELDAEIRPWVRLEIGAARVTPFLERPITSWVHEGLDQRGLRLLVRDNRTQVRCIHPAVTLLEKLDAITRRWVRDDLPGQTFVRHYEDAARIIAALPTLPPVGQTPGQLMEEMLEARQIRKHLTPDDPAFTLPEGARAADLASAWHGISGLFWGQRIPLEAAGLAIQGWLRAALQDTPRQSR